ncbi:MAG TPA: hypothetical protein VER96_12420 [Polyangiaceae bacterium]|nr:hypothetical protein [Polyangiaceae bacterium]
MSWIKKTIGVAAILGGTSAFACSGTSQVVGNDGQPVGDQNPAGKNASNGTNGTAPDPELGYVQQQIALSLPQSGPACLPEALPVDPATGNAACFVLTVQRDTDCNCAAAGLSPVSAELARVTREHMRLSAECGPSLFNHGPCEEMCVCKVDPAVGSSLQACKSQAEPNANTTGWCYVADTGDTAQQALVEDCATHQKQALRLFGTVQQHAIDEPSPYDLLFLGCPLPKPVAALGKRCIPELENNPDFRGWNVKEVNVEDHAAMCETGICLQNHFQGRVSCPYGQDKDGGDCLPAAGNVPVIGEIPPQLLNRRAEVASICSCRCAGPGPGPFCTCPESMQCEHLIDDLGFGTDDLAGSYCIPAGTQYDRNADTSTCSDGNCGPAHNNF